MELAPRITPAAALGVCHALRVYGAEAFIKWPNDAYVGGKKISGILSEQLQNFDHELSEKNQ